MPTILLQRLWNPALPSIAFCLELFFLSCTTKSSGSYVRCWIGCESPLCTRSWESSSSKTQCHYREFRCNISYWARRTSEMPHSCMQRGQRRIKCSKALLSEGQAWCSVECKRLGLLESIRRNTKMRNCVRKFWAITPMHCILARCWEKCRSAGRKFIIGLLWKRGSKASSQVWGKTGGLGSQKSTSRCQQNCSPLSNKCRRSFATNQSLARRCLSTWRTAWRRATANRCTTNNSWWACFQTQKIILYTSLMKWYFEHGLKITAVYRTINNCLKKIFTWFVIVFAYGCELTQVR